jgi:hypothetical protein
MKVAIHQVNYLPWLGFFNKIKQVDKFVMYDIAKYIKNDIQNRNKIRTKDGWIYLTVPVEKNGHTKPLYQVLISNKSNWRAKHWKSLLLNYSKADYFDSYKDYFEKLYKKEFDNLYELNKEIVVYLLKEFKINVEIFETTSLNLNNELKSTDMLLEILNQVGATTYISGMGSKDYLEENKFKDIKLKYHDFKHPIYKQSYPGFEPYMAAIDLLFNEGEKAGEMI